MDAREVCEIMISNLKCSNLNFCLEETPFNVYLNIKKSFVKNKNGEILYPPHVQSGDQQNEWKCNPENSNARVKQLEAENEGLNDALKEISDELEKAKIATADLMKEKHMAIKAKENSDQPLGQ
jgi:hypothetical protein